MPEDGTRPPLCVGSSPRDCLCCPESPWCAVQQLLTEASNAAEMAEKEKSNDESTWEVVGMLRWGTPLEMLPYRSTGLKQKGGFLQ